MTPNDDAGAAAAVATDAYVYFYALVTLDVMRRQMTNIEPGKMLARGPMNTFSNAQEYPGEDVKLAPRTNFDTLYSSAWLDLTQEPVVVSVPDTAGRFYMLPMLDMWSDVFASPGARTTGTGVGHFGVVPARWTGELPAGVTRIESPTPYVWICGRTQTNGPDDYDAVHRVQDGYAITPLSQWGKAPEPVAVTIDPSVDMTTPPVELVNAMAGADFFRYAAELMKLHPPHVTDHTILFQMRRVLGLAAGESFDPAQADPAVRSAIDQAPAAGLKRMGDRLPTLAEVVNGWQMHTSTIGVYGNYYLKRAIVAMVGPGTNLPEDASYLLNFIDSAGEPLVGAHNYVLSFAKDELPPVGAFWSVTLYDEQGFQVANPLNRFTRSSWAPLQHNPDGSLDLYLEHESPGAEKEPNWLPAPGGSFNLTMRMYAPRDVALTGAWVPPPVTKAG